jgi:hypothetical protein
MFPKMSEAAGKRITKAGDNIPSKFSSSIFFHFENAWPTTLFFVTISYTTGYLMVKTKG